MANIWDKPLNRDTLYEEQDYQQAAVDAHLKLTRAARLKLTHPL